MTSVTVLFEDAYLADAVVGLLHMVMAYLLIRLGSRSGNSPERLLGVFFLMASILTGFMSNAATAVLLAPLAITAASALSVKLGQPVDPRPFLVALTLAASAAFWTPIGYQTNLLVYGPGGYRFSDFVKIGGPLTLIYWIMATLMIPRFFPFFP